MFVIRRDMSQNLTTDTSNNVALLYYKNRCWCFGFVILCFGFTMERYDFNASEADRIELESRMLHVHSDSEEDSSTDSNTEYEDIDALPGIYIYMFIRLSSWSV